MAVVGSKTSNALHREWTVKPLSSSTCTPYCSLLAATREFNILTGQTMQLTGWGTVQGINSRVTQQCNMSPYFFMQLTGQNNGGIASSAFLLATKCNWLARTGIMSMRNATCVGTQTSKVPTRVTLLFIPYTVAGVMVMRCVMRRAWTQKLLFCASTVYSLNCDQRFQQKRDFCFISSLCLHRLMHYLCISRCVLKIVSSIIRGSI